MAQEFEFWFHVPLLQEKLHAPAYPAEQLPADDPCGVAGRLQLLIVVALQGEGRTQEFEFWFHVPLLQEKLQDPKYPAEQLPADDP